MSDTIERPLSVMDSQLRAFFRAAVKVCEKTDPEGLKLIAPTHNNGGSDDLLLRADYHRLRDESGKVVGLIISAVLTPMNDPSSAKP